MFTHFFFSTLSEKEVFLLPGKTGGIHFSCFSISYLLACCFIHYYLSFCLQFPLVGRYWNWTTWNHHLYSGILCFSLLKTLWDICMLKKSKLEEVKKFLKLDVDTRQSWVFNSGILSAIYYLQTYTKSYEKHNQRNQGENLSVILVYL